MSDRRNVLFVCSKNRWRSPTAEKIYSRDHSLNVRSRGTSRDAERTIRMADLAWADLVFVMESKHKQRLQSDFPSATRFKTIHVLDIPDDYQYMDEELIAMLRSEIDTLLEN